MTMWHVLVYVVATALALRSLISLMAHHRQHYRRQIVMKTRAELNRPSRAESKPADPAAA